MLEITFKIIANVRRYQDRKSRVSIEKLQVDAKPSVRGKRKVQDPRKGQFSFRKLSKQSQESLGSKLEISKSTEVKAEGRP